MIKKILLSRCQTSSEVQGIVHCNPYIAVWAHRKTVTLNKYTKTKRSHLCYNTMATVFNRRVTIKRNTTSH